MKREMTDQRPPALLWLSRSINFLQVLSGYGLSLITRGYWHAGMPVALSVEPTDLCNLRCPECPAGRKELTRPKGMMSLDTFRGILAQAAPGAAWLTLYFQGEPYLNPAFFSMVSEARARRIFCVTSTNGHFLDMENARNTVASGLNRIIISFDGASQETYTAYRAGGELGKVVSGIRNLAAAKKEMRSTLPEIVLQCLVLRSNEKELERIKQTGMELGAGKVVFKTAQFYGFENGNALMPEEGRYSRYKATRQQGNKAPRHQGTGSPVYEIKNPLRNRCFRMWSSCVVTWDGKVVPCCFDKDAEHEMGDLNTGSLKEIWTGENYRNFRKSILRNRKSIEICRNCTQKF
jgi:radical SAM protein with 4Fe4S-binding SPASM domain